MYQSKKHQEKPKSLEEISGIKPSDGRYVKQTKQEEQYGSLLKDIVILAPFVMSGAWLTLLLIKKNTVSLREGGLLLSPASNTAPLIIGICIFMLGYLVFMTIMFSDSMRGFFIEIFKKKKSSKNK